jgi:hypothetical protein
MDEVLIAVITALATLIGVAMPLALTAVKEKRDYQERAALAHQRLRQERRAECASLLREARDFGVKIQNSYEYHGTDMAERAWDIRQRAANISGQADQLGLLIADLSTVADAVADAVNRLVGIVADPQSLALGSSTQSQPPDIAELSGCIVAFKSAARAVLYGVPSPPDTSPVHGEFLSELTV